MDTENGNAAPQHSFDRVRLGMPSVVVLDAATSQACREHTVENDPMAVIFTDSPKSNPLEIRHTVMSGARVLGSWVELRRAKDGPGDIHTSDPLADARHIEAMARAKERVAAGEKPKSLSAAIDEFHSDHGMTEAQG